MSTMTLNLTRKLAAVATSLLGLAPGAVCQPPAQFQVWGSQGPMLAKAPMDWTELQPASEGLATLTPTEDEKRRGFVVFALDPMAPALLRTAPSAALRTESVHCVAARGQYEPLTFAFWPLEDLAQVTVQAGPLRSGDSAVIPADQVDVRVARPVREIVDAMARTWRWRPFLLEQAVYYYGLLKRRAPDLPTTTDIGGGIAMGHDEIGRLSPVVDYLCSNRLNPDLARALLERGKPWGIYNGAGPTPAGARFFFGFYGWHTAAQSIAQWA